MAKRKRTGRKSKDENQMKRNLFYDKYRWACESCWGLKDAIEIGDLPCGSLILHKGKYKILAGQGHDDDDILTFAVKPRPEPPDGDTDKDCKEYFKWRHEYNKTKWNKFDLDQVDRLSKAAVKMGCKDGYLSIWLYKRAAQLIVDFENKSKLIKKDSKEIKVLKDALDHYLNTGNDYTKVLNLASKARHVDPITVAELMDKIPEPE